MNGDVDIELDGAANGWDPNDMFRQNEHVFGVQSTFDDSLSSYTVQLDKVDSDEFKEAEAKAEKLAAEIENNPIYRERVDLENGDEEQLFAAVERPGSEIERERESDRDRELERERERERDREKEREREREREQRDREDRERNKRSGTGAFDQRETMTERYITKPTRSITGPPPPVAMASTSTMNSSTSVSSQTSGNGPTQRGQIDRSNSGGDIIMNAHPLTSSTIGQLQQQQQQQHQQQNNSTQASTVGMTGALKATTALQATSNPVIGSSLEGGNKYVGGSMMKRKTVPQGKQMIRNTPSTNNSNTQTGVSGNVGNLAQNSVAGQTGGGGGKGGNYQAMSIQNQQSYQNYSQIMHGYAKCTIIVLSLCIIK